MPERKVWGSVVDDRVFGPLPVEQPCVSTAERMLRMREQLRRAVDAYWEMDITAAAVRTGLDRRTEIIGTQERTA